MWYERDERVGVLCDWDLAEDHRGIGDGDGESAGHCRGEATEQPQNPEVAGPSNTVTGSQVVVKPRYPAGTAVLFMAMDLLREGDPPIHKYRHDFESFLYLVFGYIQEWQHASLITIGDNKRKFLKKPAVRRAIVKQAHDTLKPLLDEDSPLTALFYRFGTVEVIMDFIEDRASSPQMAKLNRADIESLKKKREDKMSFSTFMTMLKLLEEGI
ncbi:uncharacterized protein C8Q71DRAFT_895531 [Rhodofomes roseus]|uniref:Fungal-type protein kinase domain-containing protein n=1 Tax=Rhodofomes roseus TaxID=34475 RepID=A0ABQ8JX52_9APHY|nr:uncharacterized protein C8Q71DRAFT_895531 [Rhodofomes roseus]KAH9828571.1 hypothetical protein C8Q71DRAFT_895531 [Rhodofomes roseus]